jgi:periplasmic divalent cation tolerance protein
MIPDKGRTPDFTGGSAGSTADDLVLVLTTWPAQAQVETVAAALVRDGLAACVSILPPHRSVYRWEGEVEHADERQLLLKTTSARLAALEAAVHAAHPYEVPEWIVLPVQGASAAYAHWLRASCGPAE